MTEDKWQKADDRKQKTEDRWQIAEVLPKKNELKLQSAVISLFDVPRWTFISQSNPGRHKCNQ